jgi:hypothetical protein
MQGLLFTTVKVGHIVKLPQALSDPQGLVEREMITRQGHNNVCHFFGGLDQPNEFDAESLWVRGPKGA